MIGDVVGLTSIASADDVDFAIDDSDTHVIPRNRHRRFRSPPLGRRIVNFVICNRPRVMSTTAKHVNLSIDLDDTNRTTPRTHRRKPLPGIRRWIVNESRVLGVRVNQTGETAKRIKLVVKGDYTGMA